MQTNWDRYHWVSVSPAASAWRMANAIPECPIGVPPQARRAWRAALADRLAHEAAWDWLPLRGAFGPLDPDPERRLAALHAVVRAAGDLAA